MRNMLKIATLIVVAGFVAMSSVFAEKPEGEGGKKEKKDPAKAFARMDKDGSGGVTLEEFSAAHEKRMEKMKEKRKDRPEGDDRTPPPAGEIFARLDANKDGSVSKEEFIAGRPQKQHGEKNNQKPKKE